MTGNRAEKCGAWTLRQEIGRGAAGTVYLATDAEGKFAAVKVCLREELGSGRYERELRGVKLYKRIPTSEGLVRLLELGECAWGFYTVLELADDEFGARPDSSAGYRPKTLSSVIAGEKALSVKESLKLGLSLVKGLVTLQRHHLLHRDIKPGNVISVRGRLVLSDPGLLVEESEAASLVGTPGYVPPEKFVGAEGDVYSLGLTLKAASFGRPVEELAMGPTLEADTGSPLFAAWWRILNRATHPDATKRYRSAKALLKDLQFLRLRMAFSVFPRKVPFFLELAIVGLVILIGITIFKVKLAPSGSSSKRNREERKAVAQEAIDEFMARRVKEERPYIEKSLQTVQKLVTDIEKVRRDIEKKTRRNFER